MEENRIYYVGIDHGNHLMKTSNHVFENGVERQAVKPTFQANTLIYDGAFYRRKKKGNFYSRTFDCGWIREWNNCWRSCTS